MSPSPYWWHCWEAASLIRLMLLLLLRKKSSSSFAESSMCSIYKVCLQKTCHVHVNVLIKAPFTLSQHEFLRSICLGFGVYVDVTFVCAAAVEAANCIVIVPQEVADDEMPSSNFQTIIVKNNLWVFIHCGRVKIAISSTKISENAIFTHFLKSGWKWHFNLLMV